MVVAPVCCQDTKNSGQGAAARRQLVLERGVVLLLENDAREGVLDEFLHRTCVRVGTGDAEDNGVSIAEPGQSDRGWWD